MDITVTVTAADKEGCDMRNGEDCAIARAIKRERPHDYVSVGLVYAMVGARQYRLIPLVSLWIDDASENLSAAPVPFTFTMSEVQRWTDVT